MCPQTRTSSGQAVDVLHLSQPVRKAVIHAFSGRPRTASCTQENVNAVKGILGGDGEKDLDGYMHDELNELGMSLADLNYHCYKMELSQKLLNLIWKEASVYQLCCE